MTILNNPIVWTYHKLTLIVLLVQIIFYLFLELFFRRESLKDFFCTLFTAIFLFFLGGFVAFGVTYLCAEIL
jgi:hypothetical protein